jgi:hypothetical protein
LGPSTSIFGEGEPGKWPLEMYAKMIGAKGIPITAVVTEMRFDMSSSTPKITFKPLRFLETGEHEAAIEQGKSPDAVRAITMTVAQADGVQKLAAPAPKAPRKEEAPAVEVSDVADVEEEASEPTKRVAKKEEIAPKKDLTDILDDWDDNN